MCACVWMRVGGRGEGEGLRQGRRLDWEVVGRERVEGREGTNICRHEARDVEVPL